MNETHQCECHRCIAEKKLTVYMCGRDMTLPTNTERCVALKQYGKPIDPCSTCARYVHALPYQHKKSPWITLPPAFWNGERYVCEKHLEIKNGQ